MIKSAQIFKLKKTQNKFSFIKLTLGSGENGRQFCVPSHSSFLKQQKISQQDKGKLDKKGTWQRKHPTGLEFS